MILSELSTVLTILSPEYIELETDLPVEGYWEVVIISFLLKKNKIQEVTALSFEADGSGKNLVVGSLHSVVDVVETTALRAMTGKMVPYTYYVGASPMSRAGVAVAADQLPQVLTHQGTRKAQSW